MQCVHLLCFLLPQMLHMCESHWTNRVVGFSIVNYSATCIRNFYYRCRDSGTLILANNFLITELCCYILDNLY
jgi:hypothetical protein